MEKQHSPACGSCPAPRLELWCHQPPSPREVSQDLSGVWPVPNQDYFLSCKYSAPGRSLSHSTATGIDSSAFPSKGTRPQLISVVLTPVRADSRVWHQPQQAFLFLLNCFHPLPGLHLLLFIPIFPPVLCQHECLCLSLSTLSPSHLRNGI